MDETKPQSDEIDVFYEKTSDHRYVHADGAWAGSTPQLDIQIAFFTELQPMPRKIRHKVVSGVLGAEVMKDVDVGVLRESQVTILLNPITAIQLVKLLKEMVAKLKARMPEELRAELDKVINETKGGQNVSGAELQRGLVGDTGAKS